MTAPQTQTGHANPAIRSHPGPLLIALAYVGFVSLGLPDAVTGVAWPTIRDTFRLPQGAVGLVFVAAGLGYFVTSFLSGRLTQALGIGLLLAASTAVVAAAMFGFAGSPAWTSFVAFAVLHGLGSGAIDAGLNGYAANYLSARHMNWLHACYCFGAMLGPLLMTAILTTGRSYGLGYSIVGGMMLTLAALFLATRPRWGQATATVADGGPQIGTMEGHPAPGGAAPDGRVFPLHRAGDDAQPVGLHRAYRGSWGPTRAGRGCGRVVLGKYRPGPGGVRAGGRSGRD